MPKSKGQEDGRSKLDEFAKYTTFKQNYSSNHFDLMPAMIAFAFVSFTVKCVEFPIQKCIHYKAIGEYTVIQPLHFHHEGQTYTYNPKLSVR